MGSCRQWVKGTVGPKCLGTTAIRGSEYISSLVCVCGSRLYFHHLNMTSEYRFTTLWAQLSSANAITMQPKIREKAFPYMEDASVIAHPPSRMQYWHTCITAGKWESIGLKVKILKVSKHIHQSEIVIFRTSTFSAS